jgi:hypothetical protein
MNSQPGQEIENSYMDYLQEATRIFKEQQRIVLPYIVVALVLFLISGASCFAGLFAVISSRAGSWLFWLGLIIAPVVSVVGANKAKKHAGEEASKAARSKPGFEEFFKLFYSRRWWPKQMVTGQKYEQFLTIIGRKESA